MLAARSPTYSDATDTAGNAAGDPASAAGTAAASAAAIVAVAAAGAAIVVVRRGSSAALAARILLAVCELLASFVSLGVSLSFIYTMNWAARRVESESDQGRSPGSVGLGFRSGGAAAADGLSCCNGVDVAAHQKLTGRPIN